MMTSESLFAGTAEYYEKFRPGYPTELFDRLQETFELDGTGILLDLGCGTGQLTIPLRSQFANVVGVDIDEQMLLHAQSAAENTGVSDIQWICGKAEDVISTLPAVRLATVGRAFHWMNGDDVLTALDGVVEPRGGFVIASDNMPRGSSETWSTQLGEIVTRYLGPTRYTLEGVQDPGHDPFEVILKRSAFNNVSTFEMCFEREWSADSLIGYLHSTSFAAPAKFGDNLAAFEKDVRSTFGNQILTEEVRLEAIVGRRP